MILGWIVLFAFVFTFYCKLCKALFESKHHKTSGKIHPVCADSFSVLLRILSGQKGNMNENDKIQFADAYIDHV